jgi:hypothetical protein
MFHNITETDPKSLEDLILLMAKKSGGFADYGRGNSFHS